MELKESSWHAKYYKFVTRGDELPKDFCSYFWRLVLYSIVGILALLFALMCVVSVFTPFIIMFFNTDLEPKGLLAFSIALGLIIWTAVLVITTMWIIVTVKEKIYRRKWDRIHAKVEAGTYKEKGPNLIVKAFKDYKDKHCSIIDWKY